MTFPPLRRGVMLSQITLTQSANTGPLAYITGTCSLNFSSCALFTVNLPQLHHVTASHPSPGDKPPQREMAVRKNAGPSKNGHVKKSIIYICTRAHHSFLSFAHCRSASTFNPLLPKASACIRHQHHSSHTVPIHSLGVHKPSQYSMLDLMTLHTTQRKQYVCWSGQSNHRVSSQQESGSEIRNLALSRSFVT